MDIPSAKSLIRRNIPLLSGRSPPAAGNEILLQPRGPDSLSWILGPPLPGGSAPLAEFPS